MPNHDEASVIAELQEHLGRLREIREFISRSSPLSPDDKARAQGLMKTAKQSLRDRHHAISTRPGSEVLTQTQHAFLRPAIHEAVAHLRVKWDSNPSGWSGDLAEAIMDLEFYLPQLEPTPTSKGPKRKG